MLLLKEMGVNILSCTPDYVTTPQHNIRCKKTKDAVSGSKIGVEPVGALLVVVPVHRTQPPAPERR